jgi:predicted ATPase/DNA-binding winged helix-turn-helix (wHTH) protein
MMDKVRDDAHSWTFGTFELSRREMSLTDTGVRVRLGSRAFSILVALVERAGHVVSVDELMALAWPNTFVEEATLRVHIHALKKVLGDGRGSARYIVNETGRGYRFVAPAKIIVREDNRDFKPTASGLPARVAGMVGRDTVVESLCSLIPSRRLLTLVGPGGVGKTTVAIAIAERLRSQYPNAAHFIDLTSVSDPCFVASTIARAFNLSLPKVGGLAVLVTYLTDRRLLLVLDNCEHLVGAAAEITEAIHRGAPSVHILCTSREPLRADGEWIYRLSGLTLPPHDEVLTSEALKFGAIQLFVERTMASQENFDLTDHNVSMVCRICRQLDGLPLALELAAASLCSFSLAEFVDRLEDQFGFLVSGRRTAGLQQQAALADRFDLLTEGRRTANPRQQTMRATLDWSHMLLSLQERVLFRRLAVFRSAFDLQSAVACCTCPELSASAVAKGVSSLTAKSLLDADVSGETTLFRLLQSTRAYAREQLSVAEKGLQANRRHAELMRDKLTQAAADWRALHPGTWRAQYGRLIDDIRAAIDWSLGPDGDQLLGLTLTNLAGPLAFELSLLAEFLTRYETAYALLSTVDHDPVTELQITIGLARFTFHAGGRHERATRLVARALALADELKVDAHAIEAMSSLFVKGLSMADYADMVDAAERIRFLAHRSGDICAELFSTRIRAEAAVFAGHLKEAEQLAQAAIDEPKKPVNLSYHAQLWSNRYPRPTIVKARSLFLQGQLDEGIALTRAMTELTAEKNHQQPFMITMGLLACPVALWSGDWQLAAELLDMFKQHIDRYSAAYYRQQWARGYEQALHLCVQRGLGTSPTTDYGTLLHDHLCTVHEDFVSAAAVARAHSGEAGWCAAEIFRAQGNLLRRNEAPREGEALLRKAVELSQRQGARLWELRASLDLASLLARDRRPEAIRTLETVYPPFAKGPQLRDVKRAAVLWAELNPRWV